MPEPGFNRDRTPEWRPDTSPSKPSQPETKPGKPLREQNGTASSKLHALIDKDARRLRDRKFKRWERGTAFTTAFRSRSSCRRWYPSAVKFGERG